MKRISLLTITLFLALISVAAPAKRVAVVLEQPDGTTLTAYPKGDEHCHFYTDSLGRMLTMDANGFYRIATDKEVAERRQRGDLRRGKANAHRMERAKKRREARAAEARGRRAFGKPTDAQGTHKGLVILVNFLNLQMQTSNALEFQNLFNQIGYNLNGQAGSVREYFRDQSYGQFDIEFDVVGPVTVSKAFSYYGADDETGNDSHPAEMVAEACELAHQMGVNFADYDQDGDGEVEQVYVIYAGRSQHDGGVRSTIWAHEYELSSAAEWDDGPGALHYDGVKIDTYAASNEINGRSRITSIGTPCHEFSHCLGLPDLYDTSYNGGCGMASWGLMDYGDKNGADDLGTTPIGFTAYERWWAGWMELTELNSSCTVHDMPDLSDTPVAYKIVNDNNSNEFFVVENRQHGKWFQNIEGYDMQMHGLLIYHVDYDEEAWKKNAVNANANHLRMSIIPADNTRSRIGSPSYNYSGDLFPGSMNVTELTNDSHRRNGGLLFHPNSDGSFYMNKPITNIREENGLVSFDFMGGGVDASVKGVEMDGEAEAAEYYTMNGVRVARPVEKGIYIERKNNIIKKIAVR